jgi:hypothetical protein
MTAISIACLRGVEETVLLAAVCGDREAKLHWVMFERMISELCERG